MIKNRIGKLVGIQYPLIQAPMNWVSGAELAAAVSNAGGLGTLGPNAGADTVTEDVELTGERLRAQIRKVRRLTRKPFAVNIPISLGEGLRYSKKCVEGGNRGGCSGRDHIGGGAQGIHEGVARGGD